MSILLNNQGYGHEEWQQEINAQIPEIPVFCYPDISEADLDSILYALVWGHPKGDLQRYKNLKAIFSLGAGLEHLLADDKLPDVPIMPLLDPLAAEDMANYALYWVMHFHRHYGVYQNQQSQSIWQKIIVEPSCELNVTVLGLGRIGQKIVKTIQASGYQVNGWDFKPKTIEWHETVTTQYAGISELYQSIDNADFVINCLPINSKTVGLINSDFLSRMPSKATLINVSRGAIINEADLLDALNYADIKGAVLDVCCIEPLPEAHDFWHHPNVVITPHISGATYPKSAIEIISKNIKIIENGGLPEGLFDKNRGV